jgi:hypothetical protein
MSWVQLGTKDRPLVGAIRAINPVTGDIDTLLPDGGVVIVDRPVKSVTYGGTFRLAGNVRLNVVGGKSGQIAFTLPAAEVITPGTIELNVSSHDGSRQTFSGFITDVTVEKLVEFVRRYPNHRVVEEKAIRLATEVLADPAKAEFHGACSALLEKAGKPVPVPSWDPVGTVDAPPSAGEMYEHLRGLLSRALATVEKLEKLEKE